MKKILLFVELAALVLALVVVAGATAKPPVHKHKTAAGKKHPVAPSHLCRLGEYFPNGGYVKANCKPNPIFAKTICDTFLPQIKALAPGATIGPGYFPSYTGDHVSCFYTADGRRQAVMIGVSGGMTPFSDGKKVYTPEQMLELAFEEDGGGAPLSTTSQCPYPTAAAAKAGGPNNEPAPALPVMTTIAGYKAFTFEPCLDPQPDSPDYAWGHQFQTSIVAIAGHTMVDVSMGVPGVDVAPAQLMPFVAQLLRTYKTK